MWVGLLIFYVANVVNVAKVRLLRFNDKISIETRKTIFID